MMKDVQKSTSLKTKNLTPRPFLLTFEEKELPIFIEIPGEQAKTKANEFYENSISCKKCLTYGHTVKICRQSKATCVRCSNQGHNKDICTCSTEVECCHCEADYQAFLRICPIFKRETKIIQIKTKERTPRLQALQKLLRLNLNPKLIFSNAVINTSKPTRSKSPTRSEQESQSDSSKATNVTLKFYENFRNEEDNSPTVQTYGYG